VICEQAGFQKNDEIRNSGEVGGAACNEAWEAAIKKSGRVSILYQKQLACGFWERSTGVMFEFDKRVD
jgi:hypothetical protein